MALFFFFTSHKREKSVRSLQISQKKAKARKSNVFKESASGSDEEEFIQVFTAERWA